MGDLDVDFVRRLVREHGGASDIMRFESLLRECAHPRAIPRGKDR